MSSHQHTAVPLTNAVSSCGLDISLGPTAPVEPPFAAAAEDDDPASADFAGVEEVGTLSG